MKKQTIGFLGVGNMGQSLLKGLLLNNYEADKLFACDHHKAKLETLKGAYPSIQVCRRPSTLIQNSQVLVLAIKPQDLKCTLLELSPLLEAHQPLVISIAAGIPSGHIQNWINSATPLAIIRAMPNTPALLQAGITGLYADKTISPENKQIAEAVFSAVGETIWIEEEELMEGVTALSGSGPAYFFYILEAFTKSATRLGLPLQTAQKLITHTMLGAAKMALNCNDLALLRQNVTSPGGTTEAGIQALEQNDLTATLAKALTAAVQRGKALKDMTV